MSSFSGFFSIQTAVTATAMLVMGFGLWVQLPVLAIAAAGAMASAFLFALRRRRGVVFALGANECFAWRYFKTARFVRRVGLDQYSEVTIRPEKRFYDDEDDTNPYRESDGPKHHYVISLDGETEPLEIHVASDLTVARRIAKRVANFLGLDMSDFTLSV